MGGRPCFPLGPSTTTDVMDQQRSELGSSQGCAYTAKPHPRSLRGRFQFGCGNTSYAGSPSSALQTPALRLWEFNPEGPRAIQSFLGLMHKEMYKSFFGPQVECPDITEDVGLSSNRAAEQVRNPLAEHTIFYSSRSYF